MLATVLSLVGIAIVLGAVLGVFAVLLQPDEDPVVDGINALLPQSQCAQCGYPGCLPYARAIATGEADINRCPPGGEPTVQALADFLGREATALDSSVAAAKPAQVARIGEARCIGCARCLEACPVDAIVGAPQLMHTILSEECTGCGLCIAPCPVDCIALLPLDPTLQPARASTRLKPT